MQRAPRGVNEPILDRVLIGQILFVTALFIIAIFTLYTYAIDANHSIAYAQALSLNTLVFLEAFYLFYIRNHNTLSLGLRNLIGTKIVWIAVGTLFVAQIAITYMPWMQNIFRTEGISLFDFSLVFLVGFVMLGILEVEKQIRLRRKVK
jgi:magnesium-transporting ATPase (P-type)